MIWHPDSWLGSGACQESAEFGGNRSERPHLPQAGRSEPGEAWREGGPTSGVYQPDGARDKGRVGGGAMETIAGVAGADGGAGAGSVKGSGWGQRAVLARGQWTKRGKAAAESARGHSCPQQGGAVCGAQTFSEPRSVWTWLRTRMSARRCGPELARRLRESWAIAGVVPLCCDP